MNRERLTGMTILVLCWLAGILIGNWLTIPFHYLLIAAFILLIVSILRKYRTFTLFMLALLLGVLRISVPSASNGIEKLFKQETSFNRVIEGRIVSDGEEAGRFKQYELSLDRVADVPVRGKLILYTSQDTLSYGDIVRGRADLYAMKRASNPGQIGLDRYFSIRGIFGSAFPTCRLEKTGSRRDLNGRFVLPVRRWMIRRINERFGEHAAFVKNITLGIRPKDEQFTVIFRDAGLAHLLAVSGLHTGFIALVLNVLLIIAIPNRRIGSVLLIAILFFYAALCGWKAPITRATIMISLYVMARILQRKALNNHVLALAALLITAISPQQLFSVGFQLSFVAIITLINGYPWLEEHFFARVNIVRKNVLGTGLLWALRLMCTSCLLMIALAPFTLYYFQNVNFSSILSNLFGIPLLGLIMPLALLIVILPDVGGLVAVYRAAFDVLAGLLHKLTGYTASLPLKYNGAGLSSVQFAGAIIVVGGLLLAMRVRKKYSIPALALGVILILVPGVVKRESLRITCFDCGNADMALIELPGGENIMIDTGPDDTIGTPYEYTAKPYLRKRGIGRLDAVFITHEHRDHYGGYEAINDDVEIGKLYAADEFFDSEIGDRFIALAAESGTQVITVRDTISWRMGEIDLRIFSPAESYYSDQINNHSLVVRIDYGNFSALFTGDIHSDLEIELVRQYPDELDCDFLKVPHHGSETSSSKEFLSAVSPEYAYIPADVESGRGLLDDAVLQRLGFLRDRLFIGGIDGALVLETDGVSASSRTILTEKVHVDHNLSD